MSNSQKNFMSIRSKLLAAVAMLLVASFMVVSSTYAWFTLSTAPEVTGIVTQVGANGNLEIALFSGGDVPASSVTDGSKDLEERNKTWGNLVSLDDEVYGLGAITLYPSLLVLDQNGNVNLSTSLATPVYGADGRIQKLEANGMYGVYSEAKKGFVQAETEDGVRKQYGVSALGTISTMTQQQLDYATAQSTVKSSLIAANTLAINALENNGGGLVDLILKGATGSTTFATEDIAPLGGMINTLSGSESTDGVLVKLENTIKYYIIACAANAMYNESDNTFITIRTAIENNWESIMGQIVSDDFNGTVTIAEIPVTMPEQAQTIMTKVSAYYTEISTKIESAVTKYEAAYAKGDGNITWADITGILTTLMDIDKITVNGKTYEEISVMKENKSELVNFGMECVKATKIVMPDGSGVFADIAHLVGDINATFYSDIHVVHEGMEIDIEAKDVMVNMRTNLEETSGEIIRLDSFLPGDPKPRESADAEALISNTYAYVLDFAFRTNANSSNLLLSGPADRIYSEGGNGTQGAGSFMEFSTDSQTYASSDIINLMKHIRIVFADTLTGELIAAAVLDTDNASTGVNESGKTLVKANVAICNKDSVSTATAGTNIQYLDFSEATLQTGDAADVLTALSQNQQTNISVYVYLDGQTVSNADVAADVQNSVTGVLNLQFASDAKLDPMDYADLKGQGSTETSATTAASSETTASQG